MVLREDRDRRGAQFVNFRSEWAAAHGNLLKGRLGHVVVWRVPDVVEMVLWVGRHLKRDAVDYNITAELLENLHTSYQQPSHRREPNKNKTQKPKTKN